MKGNSNLATTVFFLLVSCAKNHDIERRRAVAKLPRAREKEREEDTVCSVVHIIFSRDVISEIHTRDTQISYVTKLRKNFFRFPCFILRKNSPATPGIRKITSRIVQGGLQQ